MPINQGEGGTPFLPGDILAFVSWSINGGQFRATINMRLDSGESTQQIIDNVPNTDRTGKTSSMVMQSKGEILSASMTQLTGSLPAGPGEAYFNLQLLKSGNHTVQLFRGYFYPGHTPSFPGAQEGPIDGAGRIREITTADPAANAEFAATAVPAGARWIVRSFSAQLVQGITQTPLPSLKYRQAGVGTLSQVPITTTAIGASSTSQLTWGKGLSQSSFTAVVGDEMHTAPLPDVVLSAADDVITATDGIGANTNYGPAILIVEEWIVPA